MSKPTTGLQSSIDVALRQKKLFAKVHDVDHISAGLLRVDTDYIIEVKVSDPPYSYMISKTYRQFRDLSKCFRDASEVATAGAKSAKDLNKAAVFLVRLADDFSKLIDSEPVEYFAKVSLQHVKKLSKERSRRIDEALLLITQTSNPPEDLHDNKGVSQLLRDVEQFFWSDHVVEEGAEEPKLPLLPQPDDNNTAVAVPSPTAEKNAPPTSIKLRRSVMLRTQDLEEMKKLESEKGALFLVEDDAEQDKPTTTTQKSSTPKKSILGIVVKIFAVAVTIYVLRRAKFFTVKIDGDYALFVAFVFFAMGYNVSILTSKDKEAALVKKAATPDKKATAGVRFTGSVEQRADKKTALALLRKSMASGSMNRKAFSEFQTEDLLSLDEEDNDESMSPRPLIQSPLATFPPNGDPETDLNCVSEPSSNIFNVRGASYLVDRKKCPSEQMLFPFRGADLLLTDECPEHVARNSAVFGGKLREKPTFLVNFRLPWGVFILYFEIPNFYLPFLQKAYEPDFSGSLPSLDEMSPAQRCVCRFLLGDDEHKKHTLKLIPHVEIGPWLVKSVVGSTPSIIGNKLPVNYTYRPADGAKCCYLEADLDIVASSAARKILSVVRSSTQGLTIDLGFLCEGKLPDELPEQMLTGCRIHGLDPLNSSLLPPMPHDTEDYHADQ
mmetsp:Transcript_17342/g.24702  ORF Transcript_17342/g.24702 Transcript_17342/m.24702 type:complete len:666 (+) Transcript_17342:91-2088(+)